VCLSRESSQVFAPDSSAGSVEKSQSPVRLRGPVPQASARPVFSSLGRHLRSPALLSFARSDSGPAVFSLFISVVSARVGPVFFFVLPARQLNFLRSLWVLMAGPVLSPRAPAARFVSFRVGGQHCPLQLPAATVKADILIYEFNSTSWFCLTAALCKAFASGLSGAKRIGCFSCV
jgi:hypothetical protein